MGVRGNPPGTQKEKQKGRKKVRRAAMEATRKRLGLDRKREETAEKKAMYSAWMGRAGKDKVSEEDTEDGGEQGVCPVHAAVWALCALSAAVCALCAAAACVRRMRKR